MGDLDGYVSLIYGLSGGKSDNGKSGFVLGSCPHGANHDLCGSTCPGVGCSEINYSHGLAFGLQYPHFGTGWPFDTVGPAKFHAKIRVLPYL